MKINSRLYIEHSDNCQTIGILNQINAFVEETNEQVYILSAPLTEKKYSSNYKDAVIILSPHRRILFVSLNNQKESDDFVDFVEDTLEDLGSISDRYDFKNTIDRPRKWKNKLTKNVDYNEIEDFNSAYNQNDIIINNVKDVRDLGIIVSLFIGSINNAKRVGFEVPTNALDMVKYKIQLFDGDQTRFVYDDPPTTTKLIRIQGLSGTGKTELLLHKLKDVYIEESCARIAFACYSRVLADSLKKRIPEFFDFMGAQRQIDPEKLFCFRAWGSQSDITSGFYRYICHFYNIPFCNYKSIGSFDAACKNAISEIKALGSLDEEHRWAFQYTFLDESQDFTQSMFDLCELVTEKRVYAAGDVFQNIYTTPDDKVNMEANYLLSNCYRTDPRTFMVAQSLGMGLLEMSKITWLSDSGWKACGYHIEKRNDDREYVLTRQPISRFGEKGLDEKCFSIRKSNDEAETIIEIIKELRHEFPNLSADDVGVILLDADKYIYNVVPRIRAMVFSNIGWDSNVVYETKEKRIGQLYISNYRNVKGLEFPFVICCTKGLKKDFSYRNRLYTMITRSFLRTYMIVEDSVTNGFTSQILNGIDKIIHESNIITTVPSEEERQRMTENIHVYQKQQSLRQRVEAILADKNIELEKVDKVMKFINETDNPNPEVEDLTLAIDNLIQMRYI